MNDRTRKILRFVLTGICLFSLAMYVLRQQDKQQGQEEYEDARAVARRDPAAAAQPQEQALPPETLPEDIPEATLPELWYAEIIEDDPYLEELKELDISALQETNPDVVGWISIPNTRVDYPLLQGEDNEFYLKHTWKKVSNTVGSIFLEYQNSPNFSDFNTIVYGHNMADGSMFAWIPNYSIQKYYQLHPYVYIALPEGVLRYEIFAAYKADVEGKTYGLSFRQRQTRQEFIDYALEHSTIETGVVPEVTDRILTLSTCTGGSYSSRWVAHGRLKMIKAGS